MRPAVRLSLVTVAVVVIRGCRLFALQLCGGMRRCVDLFQLADRDVRVDFRSRFNTFTLARRRGYRQSLSVEVTNQGADRKADQGRNRPEETLDW
jgi:hypothetical protein